MTGSGDILNGDVASQRWVRYRGVLASPVVLVAEQAIVAVALTLPRDTASGMINPTMVRRVPTFAEYNERTEDMISHLLKWLDEDAVLSEATRHPKLNRFATQRPMRDNINDYRRAVRRHAASTGAPRKFWELAARYQAFLLRFGARRYVDRAGFDRRWLRAPR